MHTGNWKWGLFRVVDLIVVLVMVLSNPLTVLAAVADIPTDSNAAKSEIVPMVEVEPLDISPAIEESPAEEQSVPPEEAWNTLASTLNLAGPQSPVLDGSGNVDVQYNVGCMQESAGFGLNCTANDVSIASAKNITILDDGCAFPGDTVTFKAEFEVLLTAQERFDVGLWFASDGDPNGDAAITGTCSAATPAYAPDPPWVDLDQTEKGQADDTCGDIDDAHNPLYPSVTLTVACVDDDANGKLDLPNCTSWRQSGDNSLCTSPVQAVPGAPSKCKCDTGFNIDIPVPGQIIVDKVTSPSGDPTTFNFTLTGGPSNVNIPFSLTDTSAPFKSTNLMGGTYSVVETANSSYMTSATCSDGSPANAIALAPGEIVTCTFTNTLQTGTLIVEKNLINDNSGTKACADFSYAVDGGSAVAFESDCSNSVTVLAGSHSIVEVGVPIDGYSTTYDNCSNVNVPAGGTATCTITNDDIATPGLMVEKSSATTELTAPGTVTYDYLVTNTGNTTLTGIVLSDNNDNDDMVCESNTLAKGESMTCTATHTFTQAALDAGGTLDNTVTADSNETEPVTDSLSIPITKTAAINVEKSSETTGIAAANQVVPYIFTVTNAGNVTLTEITVSDENCDVPPAYQSGDSNDDDKLQVNETWTYTCSHTVTQAEIDAGGSLSNTVTADSNESEPDTDTLDIPISQSKAIIVVKASTTELVVEAGQVVPYTFTLDNNGNTTLTGIVVTDPMCDAAPAYASGDDGDGKLQVNETWIYTCNHTVTQAEIDTKGGGDLDLDNTVTADSKESEPDTDDHAIPIDYYPFLTVAKSSTTTSLSAPETVTYSYLVKNTGNVTLTGIALSDNNDNDDMSCPFTTLAPEASMTCTATHTFTQEELDTLTSLDNIVTAASIEAPDATDDLSIPITKNAAIIVVKASTTAQIVEAGQTVPYTFTVDNEGNTTLTGVTVTDPMCDDDPAYDSGDANNDSMLQVDETWRYTCNHTVTQAEIDSNGGGDGDLDNTVTTDSNESAPDTADLAIPVDYNPKLMVDKSSTTTTITAAEQVVPYTFVLTNVGNVTLTGIVVSDAKCDTDPVLGSGDTNNDGNLQVDETWTYTCSHTVTQAEVDLGGNLSNTVLAESNESEPVIDTLDIAISQSNAIIVVKASTTAEIVEAGQEVPYTFTVDNEGNTTLTGITVSDPMCDAPPAYVSGDTNGDEKLQISETWTYSCSHIVTQAEVDAGGDLINTVEADSNESAPDTDTLEIPVTQTPAMTIVKTAMPATYGAVGDVISYSYRLTNSGNVTLVAPFTVTDDKASDEACPVTPESLAPGDTIICAASYTISQADLDAGLVTNTASGHAFFGATPVDSNEDSETVTANKLPALTIVKTATPTTYDTANDVITYSYLVTNSGNVTLFGITVVDDKATVTCPDTSAGLAPGGKVTCTATYTISQADIDSGSVTNIAYATDGTTQSPPDSETVNANKLPALTIDKTATPATYAAVGQVISYSYLVTNSGNVTLYNITVDDDKATVTCPAEAATMIPGASVTCTATYTISQADLDAGYVTNSAYATDGTTQSSPDTETVTAAQTPALTLDKTATPTEYDSVGDVINYSYLLTNSGNVTLSGPFTVEDTKVTVACPSTPAILAPLASITCTASYTITQADLDYGLVLNSAVGHAFFGDTPVDSNPDTQTVYAVPMPALAIVKTADPVTYDAVGDVISYSYLVTNTGNVTLHQVTVVDDKATVTCPDTQMDPLGPQSSMTCTASYIITQADLDSGSVTNIAYAQDGDTKSEPDSETVTAVPMPALSIVKTATPATYDAVGDLINYSYLVTNTGNVTLFGITVVDDKAAVTCPAEAASLAPLATVTCTASYTITQADLDGGSVTNSAYATDGTTQSPPDSETVTADKLPALTIAKTASPATYASVGDVISYSYLVTNSGNVTLYDITVVDNKAIVDCPDTSTGLAPLGQITCTATYTITQADLDAGSVTNTAHATDGTTSSEPDSETVNAVQSPAINLAKLAEPTTYDAVGDVITYTYVITNTGNVTLPGPFSVTDDKATVTCDAAPAGGVAPKGTISCTAAYTITQPDVDEGSVTNTATASTTYEDQNVTSEPASATVKALQNPAIEVLKSGTFMDENGDGYADLGETIAYTFTVTNTGNVTLYNIVVTDPLVTVTGGPLASLAPGAVDSTTFTASYTLTQADIDAGSVSNTATVCGYDAQDDKACDDGSNEEPTPQNPAIDVLKSGTFDAGADDYANVGELISYTFTVTNTGNVTLTGITVTDPLVGLSEISCPTATLAVGASITCTATYPVTQADIDAGSVYNMATADSTQSEPDTDEETETLPQNPAISLVKTGTFDSGADGYANVGELIAYEFVVSNEGNVTLTGITVTDPKANPVSCPADTLVVGESMTCTGTYAVTQADIDAGSVYNMATADSTQSEPDTDDETETLPQNPALMVEKTVTSTGPYDSVSDVITYKLVATNTGNVTLTNVSITDPMLGTLTCMQPVALAPGATLICTGSYAITQTDLDNGKVDNTATTTGTFGDDDYTDTDSETVPTLQSPAITLTKSANPTLYDSFGDVIIYTLVAKNTGNVTLHDVSITDPLLGALTCTPNQPATLAPNATLTCTGTYTIQAADLTVFSITNTATVNGKGPQDQPVSATATATINRQTGALLPTNTTCQQYAAGPTAWPAMYDAFSYQVKSGKINSVAPGVIFYYNTIQAPSASFTISVTQSNTLNWKPMLIQKGQAILYTSNCVKAGGVKVTTTNNPYTVKFTVTGATPGAIYYIGIKYSPQNLVGQPVKAVGGVYPTSIYNFSTVGYAGSAASIPVKPK